MTLRIGLIGAGANTKLKHIPGFQEIDGVEITAVANRSIESGQKVADEYGIPQVFDDWKEVVNSPDVDAVCIGTWPYMHCEVTLAALAADKHVLTEARMCMNVDEARQMYAASQQSDKVTMIVQGGFYLESEEVLLEMVADGAFGDWLEIHVNLLSGGYNPEAPLHWRQRRDLSGVNIMALGIAVEAMHRYAGTEKSVMAYGKTFTAERLDPDTGQSRAVDVPESLGVIAELQNGATAVYHVSSVARMGAGGSFELHGTKGSIKLSEGTPWVALEGDETYRELEIPAERKGSWQVEREFVDAVRDGTPVTRTSFADGVNYMMLTEAVQISMREGRRVELPLD